VSVAAASGASAGGPGEPGAIGRGSPARAPLLIALLAAGAAMACSGPDKKGAAGPAVPERAATAGDALLALVPTGAQVVIELDLDRARGNAVLGPLARALIEQTGAANASSLPALGELSATPLATAHAVVVASYHVGTAEAASLTLVRGDGDAAKQAAALGAVAIGEDVIALGPAELVEQAQLLVALPAPSQTTLLALRARPMPSAATGAILRVTAELSFDARLSLARQTSLDAPPARLALWADAVDDAAIVLLADSTDDEAAAAKTAKARKARQDKAAERLTAALRGALGELAREPRVAALGLGPSLRGAEIERAGAWIKVAIVVGPQRLARAVQRASVWTAARSALPTAAPTAPPTTPPPPPSLQEPTAPTVPAVPPSTPEESP
jgi:hypothetical protein